MDFDLPSFLKKHYSPKEKIVLACSTGADSMSLLYKLLELGYAERVVACYFNHHTREQCKQEEEFLVKLGKKEGFQVEVGECDFEKIQALYPSKSFEELAREKRYQFFDAVCNLYDSNKVLTAHHLDDRIETMMFNMLRGSKFTGLINMTESSGGILRPFLGVEKSEILSYLKDNNHKYFEDASNTKNEHTRNFIRNEILPKFSQVHPEHKKNLQNLLSYFEEIKTHLDLEVQSFLGNSCASSGTDVKDPGDSSFHSEGRDSFSINDFHSLSSLLQKEIIRHIYYISNNKSTVGLTEANIAEVLRFISGKNNKTKKEIRGMNLFKDGDNIEF